MNSYICTHPDAKLVAEEEFIVIAEVLPICPYCHGHSFEYDPVSGLWECSDCGHKFLEEEFNEKCKRDYLICKKCGKKLRQREDYPWVYECPKCGIVVHPELDDLSEYTNLEYKYLPKKETDTVFPDEQVVKLRMYKCPIYGLTLRIDSTFCKHNCGWREEEE